ncbi:hypothetical protein BHM03_00024585 [Ensete ventricosum]|nr:hypothetical protein BHM03_00024585 [Ensete ventricosum]
MGDGSRAVGSKRSVMFAVVATEGIAAAEVEAASGQRRDGRWQPRDWQQEICVVCCCCCGRDHCGCIGSGWEVTVDEEVISIKMHVETEEEEGRGSVEGCNWEAEAVEGRDWRGRPWLCPRLLWLLRNDRAATAGWRWRSWSCGGVAGEMESDAAEGGCGIAAETLRTAALIPVDKDPRVLS